MPGYVVAGQVQLVCHTGCHTQQVDLCPLPRTGKGEHLKDGAQHIVF